MKRWLRTLGCMALLSGFSVGAYADMYSEAYSAAETGEYLKAASLFTSLAEKGIADAQFNLALMYHGGLGVARDEGRAVKWYEQAAANGVGQAQEFLAAAYQEGWFGLPRDPDRAAYWLQRLQDKTH